jgi:hypothetical protein
MPQRVQNLILALTGGNGSGRMFQSNRHGVTQRQELLRMGFITGTADVPFYL